MKKCFLIQPGAFGDIFICAPIAKFYYDLGYEIIWPTRKKFAGVISHLPYVKHIELNEKVLHSDWLKSDTIKCLDICYKMKPDLVLNLADRGPHPVAQLPYEHAEQTKYRISNMDFDAKHTLSWSRDLQKENEIYEKFVGKETDYVVAHLTSSHGDKADMPKIDKKIIEIEPFPNDNIVGWYKVIMKSNAVYCTESSIHCFIDGFIKSLNKEKYLLSRIGPNSNGEELTVSKYWDKRYMR
jgi:ADP-heptose:LPS heptosyltransferase